MRLGAKTRILLLTIFFCWTNALAEEDGSSFYYPQDYPAPVYYQEESYHPGLDYQEDYYQERGAAGSHYQNIWIRQGEEEEKESPIPVVIKGLELVASSERNYPNRNKPLAFETETQAAMNLDGAAYGLTLFLIGQVIVLGMALFSGVGARSIQDFTEKFSQTLSPVSSSLDLNPVEYL